ncbi:MAG: aldehyde dehydrogenase family protein [Phycisphaerales bacterium]|nr:aldehyde dehydrogenase family protein [Phycisphaerales bacterium]
MATLPHPSPTIAKPPARGDFRVQDDAHADPAAGVSAWANTSLSARLAWVAAFRKLIAANSATLNSIIEDEIGKSAWEAFSGDILPLLAACRWHERHARRILAPRALLGGPVWLVGNRQVVRRAPLGRVGIIATWNYPVQLLGIQLVQALVAGNDVVVKPSERSPRSQAYLVKLARAAGLPSGTLELRDHAREAGQRMLETERFDKLVFTGSTRVGRCIAAMAAETLTPTALELSGCDSALVLDDADVGLAARVIWHAAIMNAGQTCLAPRRALVDARVYREFLAALSPLAAGAKPVTLADEAAARHTFALAEASLAHGARSLSGVLEAPSGRKLRPLAMVDCPIRAPLACTEHFGPALAVVPVAGLEAMLAAHDSIQQRLATSVFTNAPSRARAVAERLGSATVTINDCILPSSHPGAGIAGRGPSGWGTTRGPDGLLGMTRPVQVGTTSTRRRLPPEPPPPKQAAFIRRAMLWWYGGGSQQQTISPD